MIHAEARQEVETSVTTDKHGSSGERSAVRAREPAPTNESSPMRRVRDRTFRSQDGRVFTYVDNGRGPEMMAIRGSAVPQRAPRDDTRGRGEPSRGIADCRNRSSEARASGRPIAEVHVRVALASPPASTDGAEPQSGSDAENGNEISVRSVRNQHVEAETPANDADAADAADAVGTVPPELVSGKHASAAETPRPQEVHKQKPVYEGVGNPARESGFFRQAQSPAPRVRS